VPYLKDKELGVTWGKGRSLAARLSKKERNHRGPKAPRTLNGKNKEKSTYTILDKGDPKTRPKSDAEKGNAAEGLVEKMIPQVSKGGTKKKKQGNK